MPGFGLGYAYGASLIDLLLHTLPGQLLSVAFVYWVLSFVAFLFTPAHDTRLELSDERVLDSLRTWSFRAKQMAVLTNAKLYQSGVFRYGKSRRFNVMPLDSIDSVQIASGHNYLWLALSIFTSILAVKGDPYAYNQNSSYVGICVLLTALFFSVFWFGGSRQIVVRSKTTSITIDSSAVSAMFMSGLLGDANLPVTESRLFDFANRLQHLIIKPRSTQMPSAAAVSSARECPVCRAPVAPGDQFCERCGQPVNAAVTF